VEELQDLLDIKEKLISYQTANQMNEMQLQEKDERI